MEVQVLDRNIERAIKDLKRQLQKGGLFKEIKEKRFYEKPSVKKKRKRKEAQKKKRKALRRWKVKSPRNGGAEEGKVS